MGGNPSRCCWGIKSSPRPLSIPSFLCTQDEYAVYQVSEPYVPQLIAALDAAVNGMKVSASLSNLGGDTMMYLV